MKKIGGNASYLLIFTCMRRVEENTCVIDVEGLDSRIRTMPVVFRSHSEPKNVMKMDTRRVSCQPAHYISYSTITSMLLDKLWLIKDYSTARREGNFKDRPSRTWHPSAVIGRETLKGKPAVKI